MTNAIKSAVGAGHGKAVLMAGFVGLVLSDVIPTPGDALYFWDQQRLRKKFDNKELTAKQYWLKNAAGYYVYNSAWWAIVFGIVMLSKGSYSQKLKLALALTGTGLIVGVISKNIQKDKPEYAANSSLKEGAKVAIPDGVYKNAGMAGYEVTIYKSETDKQTLYHFHHIWGIRQNFPAPCIVTVKDGIATVDLKSK